MTRRPGVRAGRRPGCTGCLGALALLAILVTLGGVVAVRAGCAPPTPITVSAASTLPGVPADLFPNAQRRAEENTYLTFPEWYIVYSAEEYAAWAQGHPPSGFPFFRSIAQYWCGYNAVFEVTRGRYAFNAGDHLMLVVIGTSYSAEYALKGAYEHTIGWLTEHLSDGGDTEEDRFGAQVAADYGQFLNQVPWYEYPFGARLRELWAETPAWGRYPLRKWERRLPLSLEYAGKALYGWLIGKATGAVYEEDATRIWVWAEQADGQRPVQVLPRFTAFRDALLAQPPRQGRLLAIAGNQQIMVTAIAPRAWRYDLPAGSPIFEQDILTDPGRKRVAIALPVPQLLDALATLRERDLAIEHVYDY